MGPSLSALKGGEGMSVPRDCRLPLYHGNQGRRRAACRRQP